MGIYGDTTREDLAWAAGFFDGEGCVTFNVVRGKKYIRVSVRQHHREVLDKFQEVVGLGSVSGPYTSGSGNDCWSFQVSGFERSQAIAALLWEWLGSEKRDQFKHHLVEAHREKNTLWRGPPNLNEGDTRTCRRGHPYDGNRTKYGQCRLCMRISDAKRREGVTV